MARILTLFHLLATLSLAAEPAVKPEFHHTVFIGKPAATVWEALTRKEIIDTYQMAPVSKLELKKGGKIEYGSADKVLIHGTIVEIDEPKKLVHTFHFTGSDDAESTVTYAIEAVGDGMCALHVTHSGFAEENQTFADICGGWPVIVSSLKTLLETGKPLPWPKS